ECQPQWTSFRNRCLKVFMSASTYAAAHSACNVEGARLLRLYSNEEISDLKNDSTIFENGADKYYYTGAEWFPSLEAYVWSNTTIKAPVFKETLPYATKDGCVTLTYTGLQGVVCSDSLLFICEKDPVTCIGNWHSDSQTCYVIVNQLATWQQAHLSCLSTFTNGRLASIVSSSQNSYVSSLLASQAWIGLRAWTAQGYYTWQDGQTLGGYSNWVNRAGGEPCVSINTSGLWQTEMCTKQNSYICEYFVGDKVKTSWLVAGFVPVMSNVSSPVAASVMAPPQSVISSFVTLLLGSWFYTSGYVLRWNFQVQSLNVETKLALQIWRPVCVDINFVWPDCGSSTSSQHASAGTQAISLCKDGEYLCRPTNTCLPVAKPCMCSASFLNSQNCLNQFNNSTYFKLQLVYITTIKVPLKTTQLQFELKTEVLVQEGDVIGFQSENKDVVICEESTSSEWRNSVLSAKIDYWMASGDVVDPQVYQVKSGVVCRINAVYTTNKISLSPGNLNFVTGPGIYNFTFVTSSASSQTCSVTAMEDVGELLWVYPEARVQVISGQGPPVLNIHVEAGRPHDLTVKLLEGTQPSVTWYVNNGSGVTTSLVSTCPPSVANLTEMCQFHSSLLKSPYSSLSYVFPAGSLLNNIVVNVTNIISWKALYVNITTYAAITEVDFYHDNCTDHTSCNVTVETGKIQVFHIYVKSGDMTDAVFYEDGNIISPAAPNILELSRMFNKSATYVLSVNVSNPFSWKMASLRVNTQIKANLQNLKFNNVFDKVAVGSVENISASVEGTPSAYIMVSWMFNEESIQSSDQFVTPVLYLSHMHSFISTGNVTITLSLSDMFGDRLLSTFVVEVYNSIDVPLNLTTSSRYVPTNQEFNLTISVSSDSFSGSKSYGILVYTVDWNDGSKVITWSSAEITQDLLHSYETLGSFMIVVTVLSVYNSSHIQTGTIIITAQDIIHGLNLTYDGPKHFSENVTFTAALQSGSDVEYMLDFGDNITVSSFQTQPVFIYKYSIADVYWAVVTAKNAVSEKTYMLTLYVYDTNLLRIIGINVKCCVPVGKQVDVRGNVAAEAPDKLFYNWSFGNGAFEAGRSMKHVTTYYDFIGVYTISVKVTKDISGTIQDNYKVDIFVEEEIAGLVTEYETPLALKQPGALVSAKFNASVQVGSNLTYTWIVNNVRNIVQDSTLSLTVTEAKVYNVTVKVENKVNYQVQTVELTAIEIILGLQIQCQSCSALCFTRTQSNTTLKASMLYGTLVNFTWNINNSVVSRKDESMQYNFLLPGVYLVKLAANNSVSNESKAISIIAQDEVSGVHINTSLSIVEINTNVTFQATFTSGTSVSILWKCDAMIIKGNNSTSLTYGFTSPGYHQCSVIVFNDVSSVNESAQIAVLDHIKDLSINQSLKTKPGSVILYAAVEKEYTFVPQTNSQLLVQFEWELVMTGISSVISNDSILKYTFKTNGTYTLILTARNAISISNVSIKIEAQEKIANVHITANKTLPAQIFAGESVLFQVAGATGSNLRYVWSSGGLTLASQYDSVVLPFHLAGNFTVGVSVMNDIDTLTDTVLVYVYVRVSNVAIRIKQSLSLPFVPQGMVVDLYCQNVSGSAVEYTWTITHVLSGRQFMSSLMSISFSCNLTGIYQVHLMVRNSLSSEEDQLNLMVQGAITELKVTIQDSVIATGSSLTFTGDANLEATDVTFVWEIDKEMKTTVSFVRLFPVAGVFRLFVTAANNVSSMSKEKVIRVLDPVSDLQIADCQKVRMANVTTFLQATLKTGTNITFTWFIEMNKQNTTYAGQNISINFPAEGFYSVVLKAQNDVDTRTVMCQLQLQHPITHASLSVTDPSPDYIFQDQNVTFTATGNNLFSAVFEWKIANSSSIISKSNKYVTSIASPGNYVAALVISNGVSQVEVFLGFTVKAFLCQLPEVSRVGAMSRSLLRSQRLELEVAVDAKGCTSYLAVHKWTVVKTTECDATVDANQKVDIGDTVTSAPSLVINPRVLDVGVYCMHFTTGYQYTSVSLSVYYTVNITTSKLKAVIRGGNKRIVAVGSELHFDGALSVDVDDSKSVLNYQWNCVEINVAGGCFANSSSSTFTYQGFHVGRYKVFLQVSFPGRVADVTEQIIDVISTLDFVPMTSVVCESCLILGNYRVSSSQHVVLTAACENCQCVPAFSWKILEGDSEVFPSSDETSTGLTKEHLVLNKKGIIKDGFNYTFVVRVSCINFTSNFGYASLILEANLPPSDGSCTFYPLEIIPIKNQVIINCSGWIDKDDPQTIISYKIYVNTTDPLSGENEMYILYSGTSSTQSVYLSSFAGESVKLFLMVGDEFGAAAIGGQSLIKFKNISLPSNMTKTEYLMAQTDSVLSAIIKQASPVSLLQYAIALGQQLNEESVKELSAQTAGKGNQLEQTRAAVRDAVTICLSTAVPVSTLEDVQQMSFALRLLTEYRSEFLTEDSQKLLASTLQTLNAVLRRLISNGLAPDDVPLNDLLAVIRNLLHAANARVYSLQNFWELGRTITIDDFKTNFRDLRPEITAVVGSMKFTDISLDESHRKIVVSAVVPLLESFLVSTLQTMIVDEKSLELDIGGIKIKASRSYVKDIETQYVSETACISIPSSVLSRQKDGLDEVFQVMISHKINPYTYGYKMLSWTYVPVQTISFYDIDGSYIHVENLADNARISFRMYSADGDNNSCIDKEVASEGDVYQMKDEDYKTVTLGPRKSKEIRVPGGRSEVLSGFGINIQLFFSVVSMKNQSFNSNISGVTVYLGINVTPTTSSHKQKLIMVDSMDQQNYTFFQNNLSSSDKLHIVATNNNELYEIELSVGAYISSCEYFNTDSQTWASGGCQVQEDSTPVVTSCKCNHLTSFGAGIISITDIDFSDLENLDLLTNPVVFIVVSIIFVSYILLIILCRYLDHQDLKRISKIPLCGQAGHFLYEVTMVTGRNYNAGTSSHVGIKLYGSENKGGARHLTKPGAFQRNCRDTFLILVWHDNTGLSPSWYLSHILVKDLQTEAQFTFLVNSWLSLEMEDGVIQKTVKASDENETKQFYHQFKYIFDSLMGDLHTWFSVSNKPDHSRFTRVQRTTCCLTCVYLYMSVNAMWYGLFKSRAEVNATLSWSSFGWEEIVVALVSTIIVVPFWVGLTLTFKKSRCKASIFKEALRPGTAQTLEIDALCAFSVDGGSYKTATTLADWIPSLDRESTSDSVNQIPAGLKRTAPMYKGRRRKSSDVNLNGKERSAIPSSGSQKNFWNKDRIMQSWPDTLQHGLSKTSALKDHTGIEQNGKTPTNQSSDGGFAANKQKSQAVRHSHQHSKPTENSDEEFQMILDQAEADIARAEERRKKSRKLKLVLLKLLRQANSDDLFDSDDDWVNEGLDDVVIEPKFASFINNRDSEHTCTFDRHVYFSGRTSVASFTLPNGSSCKPGSGEGSEKNHTSLLQNVMRPSIVSSSSKSKTTLSGRLRSLSVVSQMSLQKRAGCLLPSWCVYVAYSVCAILCVISVILVLLYGYNFGKDIAIKWVVSLCFTVFISILVIEPLKILLITVYITMLTEDKGEGNSDMIDITPKIEFSEQLKDVKFRPLGGFALLQAKEEGKKKRRLNTMIREVTIFTFMFAIFLAIVYLYSNGFVYHVTSNIQSRFYGRLDHGIDSNSHHINITRLRSVPEFWLWTKKVLARSLHYRDLFQSENFGFLMGPAWLRQIRGETVACSAAQSTYLMSVPELVKRCVDSGTTNPDTRPYSVGWTPGSSNWTYSSASALDQFSKFGQSMMYMGGGYVQTLGLTYNATLNTLQQLETDGWIDVMTRAVFVEFTLYHPSRDLISCVTFLLEFPTSGGILAMSSVRTEHLQRFILGHVDPLMVCQIIFFIFILYFTIVVAAALKSHKLMFFKPFWNWVDLFICILLWANTGLYIMCLVEATSKVNAYLADLTTSAHLEKAAILHSVLRDVHASLLFLFTLKIVRQSRFFKPLYKFYTTLSTASSSLMGVFLIFTVILLTYAQFGYLFYGSAVYGYHSFQHSIMSLIGLFHGHTQFWPVFGFGHFVSHVFFISFGLFGYGLVTALSIAALTWSFKWSRAQMSYKSTLEARDYEMIEFMIRQFKVITGMQKQKPAFRHVKFEGLPSLSSRNNSSHASSRSCTSPNPVSAQSSHADLTQEYLEHCMVSIKPKWDQVVETVQKIEELDRRDEEQLQVLLKKIIKSTPEDSKFLQSSSRLILNKPPLSMTAFTKVKPQEGRQDATSFHISKNVSAPSRSIFE
ncbi:unnamed protein product, partial [Candidula unifasciata]